MDEDDTFAPKPPEPKNWAELFAITKGLRGIPMAEIEQGRPDWHYQFGSKDMRKCGRLHCEKRHGDGWLIALRDRRFVHVGHVCARSAAHDVAAWDRKLNAHEEDRKAAARRKAAIEAVDAAAVAYAFAGSDEVRSARSLHSQFCTQAKGSLLDALHERGRTGRSEVEKDRRLDDREMEVERLRRSRGFDDTRPVHVARTVQDRVGTLVGIEAFAPGKDVESRADNLLRLASRLRNVNAEALTDKQVKELHQATRELSPLKSSLTAAIAATRRFYTATNLRTVMLLEETRRSGIIDIVLGEASTIHVRRREGWR